MICSHDRARLAAGAPQSSVANDAASSSVHWVWQSAGTVSRSLFGIALDVAILLVFVASAPAQTWTPGAGYNAVTLSSNTYYTTPSYTPAGVSQFTVGFGSNAGAGERFSRSPHLAGGSTVNGQVLQVVPGPSSLVLVGFAVAGLAAGGYLCRRTAAVAATTIAA